MDSPHLSSTRFCLAIKFQHGFAGQEPLELGKLLRYAIGIASPIDALPHELQGLLAAHGAALEERLIISRRPPGTDIRHGVWCGGSAALSAAGTLTEHNASRTVSRVRVGFIVASPFDRLAFPIWIEQS